ncbi:MAG TPA: low molecular weight phosphatase family protein [Actinomycetota bacterium]
MNVLFVCFENAGRSQLAEHMFNASVSDTEHQARSCGTRPRDAVYPEVVEALERRRIDASGAVPKPLTTELTDWADRVVTMGCGDECPVTGKPTEDWELPDVKGADAQQVEEIAREIAKRMSTLLADLRVPAWA